MVKFVKFLPLTCIPEIFDDATHPSPSEYLALQARITLSARAPVVGRGRRGRRGGGTRAVNKWARFGKRLETGWKRESKGEDDYLNRVEIAGKGRRAAAPWSELEKQGERRERKQITSIRTSSSSMPKQQGGARHHHT